MLKNCFLAVIFILGALCSHAQMRNDSAFHVMKMQKDSLPLFVLLPSNYYSSHVGFFCKKEIQVQKTIGLPIKFRLGSVPYCDALEGKNNLHIPAVQAQ